MMNEIFYGNAEAFDIIEGIHSQSAVLEETNVEHFEKIQYISEVDEARVNETAEIMKDVFSEDVLTSWADMSLDEKAEKLNEYYIRAGENLGIQTKGVILESMPSEPGTIAMGYNAGDGYIHLNADVVNDPRYLGQVLDTATHEMRHQFQADVLANPENFSDIPQDVLDTWKYEMENYISPDYDFQGYHEQAIETDARDFAENVLESYVDKMRLN